MKNIKTTIFGALAAICGYLQTVPGTAGQVGAIGVGVFTFLMGATAKDASNKN
jgi:hypothetical protein